MRPIDLTGAHGTWQMLANMHRPTDPAVIAAEIRRLRQTGLTPRDMSNTLRLDLAVVLEALREAA
jgi:hypothetical protein